jgi:multimeric flavodoxin WrbA
MKVVALLASPRRKGNSNGLAESLTSIFTDEGHELSSYMLNDLTYKGCQACNGCKTRSDFCVLLDELTPVLQDVKNADVVVLASPVYWGEVNAQMKGFIDRTYSFLTPEFVTGPQRHRLPKG